MLLLFIDGIGIINDVYLCETVYDMYLIEQI